MSNSCKHISAENICYNIQNKKIYKDQCMRCYDDPQSEQGLDLCLKCFYGCCSNEIFNHKLIHMQQNNHMVFLNMKQVKKELEDKENNTKITKLAIGKPGGADFSGEEWELQLKLRCLMCNVETDYTQDSKLNDLVKSILNAASVNQQNNISAWEEEIYPCEHTLTLQQDSNFRLGSKLTSHCNSCDLSQNLWMCLTCGYLGCGRKFYDGTGGNNHAVEHFNKTKHPIVVKTGTITPSGEASLYCYACDVDVKDDQLPQHLQNFGIDITLAQKTEKTMAEMNLEFNLNFTLSKTIEDGKVLPPVYGPGYTGMENLGNSCYMNSVVQVLFSLESFKSKFFDEAFIHLTTCLNNPSECFDCQVSKLMYGLYSGQYSQKQVRKLPSPLESSDPNKAEKHEGLDEEEYQKGIKPFSFKYFFAKDHAEFLSNKQQDAFEYLNHLFEKFEHYLKSKSQSSEFENSLKQDFEFEIESRYECAQCLGVKYKSQRTWYLPLSVPGSESRKGEDSSVSLDEILHKFLADEVLELDCPRCKAKQKFSKTQKLKNFPKYFILLFQRFVYDWVPIKLEVKFQLPQENIDLGALSQSQANSQNELVLEDAKEIAASVSKSGENEEIEVEPEFDADKLNLLIMNGVPELAAKNALLSTGNNADEALMWFFSNLESDLINQPIKKIKKKKNQVSTVEDENFGVAQGQIDMLMEMGYSRVQALGALKKNGDNPERALEFLFENPDFDFSNFLLNMKNVKHELKQKDLSEVNKNNSNLYDLYGFVTHLGKNTGHGHYVSHIKKEGKWTYYNDIKVTLTEEPPIHKGYIYFLRNKSQNN